MRKNARRPGTGAKLKGERLADHALPVFHVGESSGTVVASTSGALEGGAIARKFGEVASDIVGTTSTGYLARARGAMRRRRLRGWFLAVVIVAVWWVLESLSDAFVFGQGDLGSTLAPPGPAEVWDRISLALALFGFVAYACWSGERWKAADALREGRRRFEETFLNASVGMALVGLDGRWLEVNPALCRIVGYECEELMTKTFQEITHPDDLEADLEQVERLMAGEIRAYQMEKRYRHKDGRSVWILLHASLVRDELGGGEPFYFIAQVQDITERKVAEEELRAHVSELEREAEEHASVLAERDERLRALVSRLLVAREEEERAGQARSRSGGPDGARDGVACPLTERELEVVRLLAAGSTNRRIAQELHLSPASVKGHVEHIIQKLKVRTRTEAAVKATALGLIDGPEEQKRAG